MISARSERRRGLFPGLLGLILCALSLPVAAQARSGPELDIPRLEQSQEAWLITVAPGQIYWQRFGHNAIWLREPELGLDHTFNFGYFDFEQENFFLRFLAGRMLYQSLAFPAEQEMAAYANEGRSIRAQRLNLSPPEYEKLRDHLLWHVQPANRDYLYDYYLDNCSTRIRDAIDLALDGALSAATRDQPAEANFRDHTRHLTGMTFWYYLGLETVLGRPVDRPVSRWDEMFIPAILAETVGAGGALSDRGALAVIDRWIYPGDWESSVGPYWLRYLAASVALLLIAGTVMRFRPGLVAVMARGWLALAAVLGVVMVLLWALTDHGVVGPNANLLLLNPLFLLFLNKPRVAALVPLVAVGGALALVQGWPLGWQYNLDVIALVLPLNLAAALLLRKNAIA